ncbi:MAG: T9SS type A sorting domain-containing protein [Bacteroidetes bacterium]|nr:T9SS type A sorting domain-containing protein [Bacteroidota bacterium]MBU1117211.1 T9SS type A sorting domain-containing protein [Bacteroidota bacterium]MBU1798484.1 T9SS type A sorting domain-containing protein [Bacteroidota bacterium]
MYSYRRIWVKLKVYDLLGKEVAILVNNVQSAGKYEVIFDATNLNSGIYFCTLETRQGLQTKKMLLIK